MMIAAPRQDAADRSITAHDELDCCPYTVNILGAGQRALATHFADSSFTAIPESRLGIEELFWCSPRPSNCQFNVQ
ncbi:hypothetical protein LVY72_19265 [Arthrobacter sp. I2-34]|uniref:Uncharacterized protein n=1 Tax=Arthrobacter hankyongi TaxID=2904801 RepID=A0ABS9LC63_9MICC|nr:hypothetical protein [Arthrobacter hankyongi]MCG2624037.1 hypothetical protein [Arthrobacter hankyongi]